MRKARWESKNKSAGVMTIAEVHQAAAREQAEKAAAAAQASRDSLSRGGSRAGHSRAQPGEWQSVATNARPLQRPSDFSQIGRNISSAGVPSAPTFGPTSVFNKGRGKAAGATTPPLSRQASTTNMFNALREEAAESAASGEQRGTVDDGQSRRPKLNLQKRTVPAGEEDTGDEGEAEGEAEGAEAAVEETEEVAQSRIESDMKELWGEKDAGGSRNPEDIVEYFKALSEQYRPLLAVRLVDDVFRIAKMRDAEVVGQGWAMVLEQDVVSSEVLKKG